MAKESIRRYVKDLTQKNDPHQKLEAAVRGFVELFPFGRASVFSYSPLNLIGEGILGVDDGGVNSMSGIREDVRNVPPVYDAVRKGKIEYVQDARRNNQFPRKYVHEFDLSSLIIVPICYSSAVVGCAFVDRYEQPGSVSTSLLNSLADYGRIVGEVIGMQAADAPVPILSRREIEVLQRMAWGNSIKEMADRMGISEFTIRDYIRSAMKKLGAKTRTQGVAELLRRGIIQ